MSASEFPEGYLEEYCGTKLLVVAIASIPILCFFVGLRYVARHLNKSAIGLDDILMLPSMVFIILLSASAIAMVLKADVGYHIAHVAMTDPAKITLWFKLLIVMPVFYILGVTIPKLALLAMYLRIFTQKPYRMAAYALGVILISSSIANMTVAIFQCRPVAFFWNRTIPGGRCVNTRDFFMYGSLPNILTDIALLILPIPLVWSLHTTTNVKVGLTCTFLTGSIGLVTACLRFSSFITNDPTIDGTWASANLGIWSILEPSMYLIAACLPTYRPLWMWLRQRLPTSLGGATGDTRVSGHSYGQDKSNSYQLSSTPSPKYTAEKQGGAGFQRLTVGLGSSNGKVEVLHDDRSERSVLVDDSMGDDEEHTPMVDTRSRRVVDVENQRITRHGLREHSIMVKNEYVVSSFDV